MLKSATFSQCKHLFFPNVNLIWKNLVLMKETRNGRPGSFSHCVCWNTSGFPLCSLQLSKQYQDFSSIYASVSKLEVRLQRVVKGYLQPFISALYSKRSVCEEWLCNPCVRGHLLCRYTKYWTKPQTKVMAQVLVILLKEQPPVSRVHCIMMAPRTAKELPPLSQGCLKG